MHRELATLFASEGCVGDMNSVLGHLGDSVDEMSPVA